MAARSVFLFGILGAGLLVSTIAAQGVAQNNVDILADWRVEDIGNRGLPDGAMVTLSFADDGKLSGRSGCNRYVGGWSQDHKGLTFTPLAMTRMACVPALMEVEARFADAANRVAGARIDDTGALVLLDNAGSPLMIARKEDGS